MSEHQPAHASVASTSYPQGLLKGVEGVSLEVSWHVSISFQHSIQGSFLLCEGEHPIDCFRTDILPKNQVYSYYKHWNKEKDN